MELYKQLYIKGVNVATMELEQLLVEARKIWGDLRMDKSEIAVALGVVYGDICRSTRDNEEEDVLKKELGNILFSTLRWMDDLGFETNECVRMAMSAQAKFANNLIGEVDDGKEK